MPSGLLMLQKKTKLRYCVRPSWPPKDICGASWNNELRSKWCKVHLGTRNSPPALLLPRAPRCQMLWWSDRGNSAEARENHGVTNKRGQARYTGRSESNAALLSSLRFWCNFDVSHDLDELPECASDHVFPMFFNKKQERNQENPWQQRSILLSIRYDNNVCRNDCDSNFLFVWK